MPAAGIGQRMGSGVAKQYLKIGDRCILQIALEAILRVPGIAEVLVCTAVDDKVWPNLEIAKHPDIDRCDGGASRAQSVMNGLNCLSAKAADNDWVMVHDAARPCIYPEQITNLIDQLEHDPVGGILAVPAKDTLKVVSTATRVIENTFDRRNVWCAQTPQLFRFSLLRKALAAAIEDELEITDEASAVELAGHRVNLIEGDTHNLKITTPADLLLAEAILSSS